MTVTLDRRRGDQQAGRGRLQVRSATRRRPARGRLRHLHRVIDGRPVEVTEDELGIVEVYSAHA